MNALTNITTIVLFLQLHLTRPVVKRGSSTGYGGVKKQPLWTKKQAPWIKCADGSTVSVQASETHYSTPSANVGPYINVEVGYPTMPITEFDPTLTPDGDGYISEVAGYVPIERVAQVIANHGGIAPEMLYRYFALPCDPAPEPVSSERLSLIAPPDLSEFTNPDAQPDAAIDEVFAKIDAVQPMLEPADEADESGELSLALFERDHAIDLLHAWMKDKNDPEVAEDTSIFLALFVTKTTH